MGNCFNVSTAICDDQWILFEAGTTRRHTYGALGNATQLHDAFGDQIHIGFHCLVNFVEEFMQPEKVWAFHVPMCLLQLHLEIHRVRQTLVRQHVEFQPEFLGNILLGFIYVECSPRFRLPIFHTVLFPSFCWPCVNPGVSDAFAAFAQRLYFLICLIRKSSVKAMISPAFSSRPKCPASRMWSSAPGTSRLYACAPATVNEAS